MAITAPAPTIAPSVAHVVAGALVSILGVAVAVLVVAVAVLAVALEVGRLGAVAAVAVLLGRASRRSLAFGRVDLPSALIGFRPGEALALRWEDIDLGARTITVERQVRHGREGIPKSGEGRKVDIVPTVAVSTARFAWLLQ